MSYIGSSAAIVPVSFSAVGSQAFNGDNSSVEFTLSRAVAIASQIEVLVNNVQQSPYDGSYSVFNTTLTFSEAPSTGSSNIYVNYRDQAIGTIIDETSVAKTGDTMSGTLIINGGLFVNNNEVNLDDLQSLSWGDGSAQVRGNGAAETLELRTSATTRLYVTASGNVGIGTSIPATALEVAGTITADGLTETVFALSGTTPALSPNNGTIQTWTLSGSSTPTAGTWGTGQSLTLMVDDGTAYAITWSSLPVVWKTGAGLAPTLNTSGETAIQLWKVGSTIYGARVGDA